MGPGLGPPPPPPRPLRASSSALPGLPAPRTVPHTLARYLRPVEACWGQGEWPRMGTHRGTRPGAAFPSPPAGCVDLCYHFVPKWTCRLHGS